MVVVMNGQPPIRQQDFSELTEHDILGLDIAMDNPA